RLVRVRARRDRTIELDRADATGAAGVEGGHLDRVAGDERRAAQVDACFPACGERAGAEAVRAVWRKVLAGRDRVLHGRETVLRLRARVLAFLEYWAAEHSAADPNSVEVRAGSRVQRRGRWSTGHELPVGGAEPDLDLARRGCEEHVEQGRQPGEAGER